MLIISNSGFIRYIQNNVWVSSITYRLKFDSFVIIVKRIVLSCIAICFTFNSCSLIYVNLLLTSYLTVISVSLRSRSIIISTIIISLICLKAFEKRNVYAASLFWTWIYLKCNLCCCVQTTAAFSQSHAAARNDFKSS